MATFLRQLVHYFASHPRRLTLEPKYHQMQQYVVLLVDYVVPAPSDRIPITYKITPYALIPFILLLTMGCLARRPGTWLIRLAIMPFALAATLRAAYGYEWTHVELNGYNVSSGLAGLTGAAKAIELGLSRKGLLKVGEVEPGVIENPALELDPSLQGKTQNGLRVKIQRPSSVNSSALDRTSISPPPTLRATFLRSLQDGMEALCALRGIGWKFGTGTDVFIPKETRDTLDTHRFLFQTFKILAISFLVTDFLESSFKLVPGLGTPAGGSMFVFGSNPWETYASSIAIEAMSGFMIMTGLNVTYYFVSFLCIVILHHEPTSWPPLLDAPWATTSLHDFWSKNWHQLLRQTFLVTGGYPLGFLFGKQGRVLGTFLASGCYHSWGLYAMGRGADIHCIIFFALQPVGFAVERLWKKMTGHRVGGWLGAIWVWLWIMGGGRWAINAWHLRGFAGGMVIPPFLSPTRLVLFPILFRLLERFL